MTARTLSALLMLASALLVTAFGPVPARRAYSETIPYGDFTGSDAVHFNTVRELNEYVDPLLTPPSPLFTELTDGGRLVFEPDAYIQTDQSTVFDLKTKTTTLNMFVTGQAGGPSSGLVGYFIDQLSFTVGGEYGVWAPFSNASYTSEAQVEMAASLTIRLSGLNWNPVAGSTFSREVTITPTSPIYRLGPGSLESGSWSGNLVLTEANLREALGITNPEDYITEVAVSFNTRIAAASFYGMGEARLTGLEVSAGMEPVAVPEPPTIILAGLGAAAAVGHGYRRRKLRQRDAEGSIGEWNTEEGAIALTA
jgi:hypothetical protein